MANITGLWDDYEAAFKQAAILVNVHQTNHHHTLEELRILPAILQGLLVVTEEAPLLEEVPYRDFIVSAPFDDLADPVRQQGAVKVLF